MGIPIASALYWAAPCRGCLIAATSAYPSTICIVSKRVSPFATDVPTDVKFNTDPPSLFMADSKDILVLVEFSKNMFARTFPSSSGR